jgi:HSP20 family protein
MANAAKNVPIAHRQSASGRPSPLTSWFNLHNLRRQIDHLFEAFSQRSLHLPFRRRDADVEQVWQRGLSLYGMPVVDIAEKEKSFEMTAELPGMDEKNIEITLSNGNLVIKGEKRESLEEQKQDYYLSERRYGAFERTFPLPKGIDADQIDASFARGVLTVSLPKRPEAIKPEKIIPVKSS